MIRWSVCISKSLWGSYVSFSRMDSGLILYNLVVWFDQIVPWDSYKHSICSAVIWIVSLLPWISISRNLFYRLFDIVLRVTDLVSCVYHSSELSNFYLSHNSQWIAFHTQSYLVLYLPYTSLLHSFCMLLTVSSLPPHNQHLLFFIVSSFFALTKLVLVALYCASI